MKYFCYLFLLTIALIPTSLFSQETRALVAERVENETHSCPSEYSGNSGFVIVSSIDDLILHVTSGNLVAEQPKKVENGKFVYTVILDISDRKEGKVQVSPKGNTTNNVEITSKQLSANKLLVYSVEPQKKAYSISFPTVAATDKYMSKTEALIQINATVSDLDIELPTSFPFSVSKKKHPEDATTTIYDIVVPVAKINEYKDKLAAEEAKYVQEEDKLLTSGCQDQSKWDELDKFRAQLDAQQASLNACSSIYVNIPSVGQSFPIDNVTDMTARDKVIVAVVKITPGALANAESAKDRRQYDEAKQWYEQAVKDATTPSMAEYAKSNAETMGQLSEMAITLKRCADRWRALKNGNEDVKQNVVEGILLTAIDASEKLYYHTHDEFYNKIKKRFTENYGNLPIVVEGVINVRDYKNGVMILTDLCNCEIYGANDGDKQGEKLCDIANDGTFKVSFKRGAYDRLIFKPIKGSPLLKMATKKLKEKGLTSEKIEVDFTNN